MDPLAHTLVGAALAETGLKRRSPLATATLMVGANLPDIDAFVSVAGADAALYWRRGVTHGVIGLLVLPWLLAGSMVLFDRWRRRRHPEREGPHADFRVLLALSYLGVLSHPLLDWLNTYGVRLLSPFSDRWFYGDALFILDPWMWLLAGCAVALAHSKVKASAAGWLVLGAVITGLVLLGGVVPVAAMIVWCVAVLALAVARVKRGPSAGVSPLARVALGVLALYVAGMYGLGRLAERQVETWARALGWEVEGVMSNPLPADPFRRDVVLVLPERYEFATAGSLGPGPPESTGTPMSRLRAENPLVAAALAAPSVRGFRNWMRFPSAQVTPLDDGGHRVTLYDVRYARTDGRRSGIGFVQVELDAAGSPR